MNDKIVTDEYIKINKKVLEEIIDGLQEYLIDVEEDSFKNIALNFEWNTCARKYLGQLANFKSMVEQCDSVE